MLVSEEKILLVMSPPCFWKDMSIRQAVEILGLNSHKSMQLKLRNLYFLENLCIVDALVFMCYNILNISK